MGVARDEDALDLAEEAVLVVGLARSGVAAAEFVARRGGRVTAVDRKPERELPADALSALRKAGARLETGEHRAETFRAADLVVVSPGVPWEDPALVAAREAGVTVMGELELAYRHLQGRVAAVTGTKGKSTTTAALGAMLGRALPDVRVGGNIGAPLVGMVEGSTADTVFVVEVSSFQLEGTERFHPQVAVFLNLSPDHLDRHRTMQAYGEAKARIFANQTETDWAVVNADDPQVLALARGRAQRVTFGPAGDAHFEDGSARFRGEDLFARGDLQIPGAHLASDMLAAATAARLMGAPAEAIRDAVRDYRGVEHVLEKVGERRGVSFFNDSKATNVEAVHMSLEAFEAPVLPIMGGRFKGGDFGAIRETVKARCRAVLAIGEATPLVVDAFSGVVPVHACASLAEAVDRGFAEAQPGDVVLLAPGCASFDMFADYAARGRAFKAEVARLLAGPAGKAP